MRATRFLPHAAATLLSLLAARARAQQPTALSNQAPASSGSTQVAQTGFQQAAQPPGADFKDSSRLKLSAGGFLSTGNARSLSLTASGDYFLRRLDNQFEISAAANYGRSGVGRSGPTNPTVVNYQARARYDRFFTNQIAGLVSVSALRDRFQGLNLRLSIDPGLAYYFIDQKSQRFWTELGYDLQYDVRRQEFIDAAALQDPPVILDDTEVRHNVRLFVGYDNQISQAVKFNLGVEYLQNVQAAKNARVNVDAGLTSQLSGNFSIAATVSVRYDHNPLPGVEKTDVISALNLVYTLSE
jgi:putative salt-induced outer membrane protein